jgi:phage minor structural protein
MIPIIYPYNEQTFKTNGYGRLPDCISCSVTEELNGAYTLELKYFRNGIHAEYLVPRNIIVCKPNSSVDREAFRICKVTRTLKNAITVYAYQLSYDLSGYVVLPGTSADLSAAITKLNAAAGNFTISTSKTSSADFVVDVPSSVRSWFGGKEGSLIDLYGGEWYFNMWSCQLRASRGVDNGLRIAYGVNLAEYQKELNDNMYAYVQAYFAKDIADTKTVVYGTAVSTGATGTDRTLILDATNNWNNSVPSSADLTSYATSYVSAHSTALQNHSQTITITPEILSTQEISLGDTVHVIYDNDIVTTRVVKTVWDALGERYTTVELGTKKANIAETIKALGSGSGGGGGSSIIIDSALSLTSTNPVQNKVVKTALDSMIAKLTFTTDTIPTSAISWDNGASGTINGRGFTLRHNTDYSICILDGEAFSSNFVKGSGNPTMVFQTNMRPPQAISLSGAALARHPSSSSTFNDFGYVTVATNGLVYIEKSFTFIPPQNGVIELVVPSCVLVM